MDFLRLLALKNVADHTIQAILASVLLPAPLGPATTQSWTCLQLLDDGFHACLQVEINELTATIRILLHNVTWIGRVPIVDWVSGRQVRLRCLAGIAVQVTLELFLELTLLLWRHR